MKIYNSHFNANTPSTIQINVPNFSDFKLGFDVEANGKKVDLGTNDIKLVAGNNVISADEVYNGYVTFALSSGNSENDTFYTLSCEKNPEVMTGTLTCTASAGPRYAVCEDETFINSIKNKQININDITITGTDKYIIELYNQNTKIYTGMLGAIRAWRDDTTHEYVGDVITIPDTITSIKNLIRTGGVTEVILTMSSGEYFKSNFKVIVNSQKSTVCYKSQTSGGSEYILPVASDSTLGGVKINGNNLTIAADGTLSASTGSSYTLPTATSETLGGVKIGNGINITDGAISVDYVHVGTNYEVTIGDNAVASREKTVTVGSNAQTTSWGSVAIGFGAKATKAAVAIGHSDDNDGVPAYDTAYAGDYAVAIGTARAEGARSVSIGQDSKVTSTYSIAIGNGPNDKQNRCSAQGDIAIGQAAKTTGVTNGHVAIGYLAESDDNKMTVIGTCADKKKIYFGLSSLNDICNYPVVSKTTASVTLDDNAVNYLGANVTSISVPNTTKDTIVYINSNNIDWNWNGMYRMSDNADVMTYTIPAIFTIKKISNDEYYITSKHLVEIHNIK